MDTGPAKDDAMAALVMAEALSCAIRSAPTWDAVSAIRRFADDDHHVIEEAQRRCLTFDGLDRQTRRAAAELLREAQRVASASAGTATGGFPHGRSAEGND